MMKILFLVNHSPYPPIRGDKTRDFNVIKYFSEKHQTDVCFIQKFDDPSFNQTRAKLWDVCSWECTNLNRWAERALRLIAVLFGTPSQVFSLQFIGFKKKISDLIDKNKYDVIISEKFYAAILIPNTCSVPVIVDNHNIEYVYYRSLASVGKNVVRSLFYRLDANNIFKAEKEILNKSAGSIFLSKADYEIAKKIYSYNKPFKIVPQGIDGDRIPERGFQAANYDGAKQSDLLFVGNLTQSRNYEPLCEFIKFAQTVVSTEYPSFRMVIIGKGAPKLLTDLCDGIHFKYVGFQKDLDSWLHNTKLVFSYIPGGSGVKTKIIEGIAFNKPVICDRDSASAVPDLIPYGIVIAESIEDIWNKICAILTDEGALNINEEACSYISQNYTWENLIKRYLSFVESIIKKIK